MAMRNDRMLNVRIMVNSIFSVSDIWDTYFSNRSQKKVVLRTTF